MPAPQAMGIYPSDSVTEVAHSLPIDALGAGAADYLAGDVEYRLHLIVQEAKKFMVHGKRTTLLPEDVEHALEALNVEPILVPPRPLAQQPFASVTVPSASGAPQQVYHVPDDEIDFATYLKEPLPAAKANSAGVKWKAHWLAVEGVQPAIPENPAPNARAGPSRLPPVPSTGSASLRPSAKAALPQELQLYFSRLTTALIPSTATLPNLPAEMDSEGSYPDAERHRQAALASVRSDQAMSGILVYFVKWLSESVQKCLMSTTGTIDCLLQTMEALLGNESIFLEPYLHQLLPPLLSIILTFPLGSPRAAGEKPAPFDLRVRASEILGQLVHQYQARYAGLVPRLVSTLTQALKSPPVPPPGGQVGLPVGRYEGAVLGLGALGPPSVRAAVWGHAGDGLQAIEALAMKLYPDEGKRAKSGLIKATNRALSVLTSAKKPEGKMDFPRRDGGSLRAHVVRRDEAPPLACARAAAC